MYKRRYLGRRTEKEIEQDVMRAIATIISEKGISSVTIKEVSNLSKTDVIRNLVSLHTYNYNIVIS